MCEGNGFLEWLLLWKWPIQASKRIQTFKHSNSMNEPSNSKHKAKSRNWTSRISCQVSKAKVWANTKNVAFANSEFNEGKYVHTTHKWCTYQNGSHSPNCSHLKDDRWNWHIPFICCSLSVAYGFSSDDSSINCAVDYNSIYNCLGLNLICNHLCLASSTHILCVSVQWRLGKYWKPFEIESYCYDIHDN